MLYATYNMLYVAYDMYVAYGMLYVLVTTPLSMVYCVYFFNLQGLPIPAALLACCGRL